MTTAKRLLDDLGMMLLVVLLIPFVIIAVGAPVVLVVRLILEIAERL